jgi:general secretion pathway protein G
LIELMTCLAVIAALATVAMPIVELTVVRGKERELRAALGEIRGALDEYKRAGDAGRIARDSVRSGYPANLLLLVDGVTDIKDQAGASRLYFLRRIPRDPFFTDPSVPAHLTWGLRSYASSADRPQSGEDVYDVYSMSSATGLNGIPYRQW